MSSPDRPVLLPSSFAWNADARLVGEVLGTVGSAAARTLDDTRYLRPTLTRQIAAELVGDCATTDYRPEHVRALTLPVYALDATGHPLRLIYCDDASQLANQHACWQTTPSLLCGYSAERSVEISCRGGGVRRGAAGDGGEIRGPLTGHRVGPRPSSHAHCAVQADKVVSVWLHAGPEAFLDHGEPEVAPLR